MTCVVKPKCVFFRSRLYAASNNSHPMCLLPALCVAEHSSQCLNQSSIAAFCTANLTGLSGIPNPTRARAFGLYLYMKYYAPRPVEKTIVSRSVRKRLNTVRPLWPRVTINRLYVASPTILREKLWRVAPDHGAQFRRFDAPSEDNSFVGYTNALTQFMKPLLQSLHPSLTLGQATRIVGNIARLIVSSLIIPEKGFLRYATIAMIGSIIIELLTEVYALVVTYKLAFEIMEATEYVNRWLNATEDNASTVDIVKLVIPLAIGSIMTGLGFLYPDLFLKTGKYAQASNSISTTTEKWTANVTKLAEAILSDNFDFSVEQGKGYLEEAVHFMTIPNCKILSNPQEAIKLEALIKNITTFLSKRPPTEPGLASAHRTMAVSLGQIVQKLSDRSMVIKQMLEPDVKPVPFAKLFFGDRNVGKSMVGIYIKDQASARMGISNKVYNLVKQNDHSETYREEPHGVIDEFLLDLKNPIYKDMNSLISPIKFNLAGAALGDKLQYVKFLSLTFCSNMNPERPPDIGSIMEKTSVEAFWDRFSMFRVIDTMFQPIPRNHPENFTRQYPPDFSNLQFIRYVYTQQGFRPFVNQATNAIITYSVENMIDMTMIEMHERRRKYYELLAKDSPHRDEIIAASRVLDAQCSFLDGKVHPLHNVIYNLPATDQSSSIDPFVIRLQGPPESGKTRRLPNYLSCITGLYEMDIVKVGRLTPPTTSTKPTVYVFDDLIVTDKDLISYLDWYNQDHSVQNIFVIITNNAIPRGKRSMAIPTSLSSVVTKFPYYWAPDWELTIPDSSYLGVVRRIGLTGCVRALGECYDVQQCKGITLDIGHESYVVCEGEQLTDNSVKELLFSRYQSYLSLSNQISLVHSEPPVGGVSPDLLIEAPDYANLRKMISSFPQLLKAIGRNSTPFHPQGRLCFKNMKDFGSFNQSSVTRLQLPETAEPADYDDIVFRITSLFYRQYPGKVYHIHIGDHRYYFMNNILYSPVVTSNLNVKMVGDLYVDVTLDGLSNPFSPGTLVSMIRTQDVSIFNPTELLEVRRQIETRPDLLVLRSMLHKDFYLSSWFSGPMRPGIIIVAGIILLIISMVGIYKIVRKAFGSRSEEPPKQPAASVPPKSDHPPDQPVDSKVESPGTDKDPNPTFTFTNSKSESFTINYDDFDQFYIGITTAGLFDDDNKYKRKGRYTEEEYNAFQDIRKRLRKGDVSSIQNYALSDDTYADMVRYHKSVNPSDWDSNWRSTDNKDSSCPILGVDHVHIKDTPHKKIKHGHICSTCKKTFYHTHSYNKIIIEMSDRCTPCREYSTKDNSVKYVPPMASETENSFDQFKKILDRNVVQFGSECFGLMLGSRIGVTVHHAFMYEKEKQVMFDDPRPEHKGEVITTTAKLFYGDFNTDKAYFVLPPSIPEFPSIHSKILMDELIPNSMYGMSFHRLGKTMEVTHASAWYRETITRTSSGHLRTYGKVFDMIPGPGLDIETVVRKGDCGLPCSISVNGAPKLVGIHCSINKARATFTHLDSWSDIMAHYNNKDNSAFVEFNDEFSDCKVTMDADLHELIQDLNPSNREGTNCLILGDSPALLLPRKHEDRTKDCGYLNPAPLSEPNAHAPSVVDSWRVQDTSQLYHDKRGRPDIGWTGVRDTTELPHVNFPYEKIVTELYSDYVKTIYRPNSMIRLSEAINGFYRPSDPRIGSFSVLNMKSSAGYLARHKFRVTEKNAFFDLNNGHYTIKTTPQGLWLRDSINTALQSLEKGLYLFDTDFHLKRELRPISKVNVGKTRLFALVGIVGVIVGRMIMGDLISDVYQSRYENPSQVGINTIKEISNIRDGALQFMREVGAERPLPIDFARYDKTIRRLIIKIIATGQSSNSTTSFSVWYNYLRSVREGVSHYDGTFFRLMESIFSGETGTTVLDGEANIVFMITLYVKRSLELGFPLAFLSVEHFMTVVRAWLYGDDNYPVWSPTYFNSYEMLIEYYGQIGLTATRAGKGLDIDDTFCSRFVDLNTTWSFPGLNKTTIWRMLHWLPSLTDLAMLEEHLRNIRFEAALWDSEFYDSIMTGVYATLEYLQLPKRLMPCLSYPLARYHATCMIRASVDISESTTDNSNLTLCALTNTIHQENNTFAMERLPNLTIDTAISWYNELSMIPPFTTMKLVENYLRTPEGLWTCAVEWEYETSAANAVETMPTKKQAKAHAYYVIDLFISNTQVIPSKPTRLNLCEAWANLTNDGAEVRFIVGDKEDSFFVPSQDPTVLQTELFTHLFCSPGTFPRDEHEIPLYPADSFAAGGSVFPDLDEPALDNSEAPLPEFEEPQYYWDEPEDWDDNSSYGSYDESDYDSDEEIPEPEPVPFLTEELLQLQAETREAIARANVQATMRAATAQAEAWLERHEEWVSNHSQKEDQDWMTIGCSRHPSVLAGHDYLDRTWSDDMVFYDNMDQSRMESQSVNPVQAGGAPPSTGNAPDRPMPIMGVAGSVVDRPVDPQTVANILNESQRPGMIQTTGPPDMSSFNVNTKDLLDHAYQPMDSLQQITLSGSSIPGTVVAVIPYGPNQYLNRAAGLWVSKHKYFTGDFRYTIHQAAVPMVKGELIWCYMTRTPKINEIVPLDEAQKIDWNTDSVAGTNVFSFVLGDKRRDIFYRAVSDFPGNEAFQSDLPSIVALVHITPVNQFPEGSDTVTIRIRSSLGSSSDCPHPFRAFDLDFTTLGSGVGSLPTTIPLSTMTNANNYMILDGQSYPTTPPTLYTVGSTINVNDQLLLAPQPAFQNDGSFSHNPGFGFQTYISSAGLDGFVIVYTNSPIVNQFSSASLAAIEAWANDPTSLCPLTRVGGSIMSRYEGKVLSVDVSPLFNQSPGRATMKAYSWTVFSDCVLYVAYGSIQLAWDSGQPPTSFNIPALLPAINLQDCVPVTSLPFQGIRVDFCGAPPPNVTSYTNNRRTMPNDEPWRNSCKVLQRVYSSSPTTPIDFDVVVTASALRLCTVRFDPNTNNSFISAGPNLTPFYVCTTPVSGLSVTNIRNGQSTQPPTLTNLSTGFLPRFSSVSGSRHWIRSTDNALGALAGGLLQGLGSGIQLMGNRKHEKQMQGERLDFGREQGLLSREHTKFMQDDQQAYNEWAQNDSQIHELQLQEQNHQNTLVRDARLNANKSQFTIGSAISNRAF